MVSQTGVMSVMKRAVGFGLGMTLLGAAANDARAVVPAAAATSQLERTSSPATDSVSVVAPPELPHQAEVLGCGHARAAMMMECLPDVPPGAAAVVGQNGIASLAGPETDVLNYNLDLAITPSPANLAGTNIITVRSLINGLSSFTFQLHQNLAISSVLVNNVSVVWNRLDIANVSVTLDHAYNANEQFDLKVVYSGTPVSGGFGSINFTTHNGSNPLVFTLSEPYYAYTWWPVKDDNRDKATADLAFTVPNTMVVASNGLLQGVDVVAGNKLKYRWRTNYQTAPYLFCFSATNYNQFSDTWTYGGNSMPMQFYIYPENDTPSNRNAWLATNGMLTTFSNLYGKYPFANEKYGIYNFGFGGGMEHQTMTGQGTFSETTTAHELAHQWWGDKVTCATWGHIWLNEGFADYSEAIWQEFKSGSSNTAALNSFMSSHRPSSMNTIVYRFDTSSAGIIFNTDAVYYKGGWVLHMLRHIMGDAAFFNTLNAYNTLFAYQAATTEDFQAVAEQFYGSSLNWFFQPWIYQTGAPTYQYAWRNVTVGGGSYIELYLNQTQNAAWPTFKMPIDVVATIGSPVTYKVWNDLSNAPAGTRAEHLLFPVSGSASALSLDPSNYILHPTNTTTSFVEGPPKIVKVVPAPGTQASTGQVTNLDVTFHKNVNAAAGQFSLAGDANGSIPFTFAYNSATFTATVTPTVTLPPDGYTLTVSATLTDVIAGKALDGEIALATDPASLPSGDGLPGGNAVIRFNVVGTTPCTADITGNMVVNIDDLLAVINAWGQTGPNPADVNHSGVVDIDDLLQVITQWGPCM